jgi:hypothetical protein
MDILTIRAAKKEAYFLDVSRFLLSTKS